MVVEWERRGLDWSLKRAVRGGCYRVFAFIYKPKETCMSTGTSTRSS